MYSKSIIIIGGGLGGLFTGALLAKEGYGVTVLEKNAAIGGGLQTFQRAGVTFETGMHILGGLRPGASISKICQYLGVYDQLQLRDVDHDCIDSITYSSSHKTYRIPEGREAFTSYFVSEFPTRSRASANTWSRSTGWPTRWICSTCALPTVHCMPTASSSSGQLTN